MEIGFVWTGNAPPPASPPVHKSDEKQHSMLLDTFETACRGPRDSECPGACPPPSESLLRVSHRHGCGQLENCSVAGGGAVTVPLGTEAAGQLLRLVLRGETTQPGRSTCSLPQGEVLVRREVVDSKSLQVDITTQVTNGHEHLWVEVLLTEPAPELLHPWWHRYFFVVSPAADSTAHTTANSSQWTSGRVMERLGWRVLTADCESATPCSSSPLETSRVCSSGTFSVASAVVSQFVLPPQSALTVSLPLSKRFVGREFQQTDASRGLDVPPSIVHYRFLLDGNNSDGSCSNNCRGCFSAPEGGAWRIVVTDSWLVTLPFPDASMPFNVITLVGDA